MKIAVHIQQAVAHAARKEQYGIAYVDVPIEDLSDRQLAALLRLNRPHQGSPADYDLGKGFGGRYNGGEDRFPYPEATVENVLAEIDRLADRVAERDAEQAESDRREAERKVAEAERKAARDAMLREMARRALDRAETDDPDRTGPLSSYLLPDEWKEVGYTVDLDLFARDASSLHGAWTAFRRRRSNAIAKQTAQREQEERARLAAEDQERLAWIAEHGSPRLKRLVAEEIEHLAVYRDERLALERPGWCWADSLPKGNFKDPRNATEAALALLDTAREADQEADLNYYVEDDEYGDEGDRYYVASARFLGRHICLVALTVNDVEEDPA